jgi:hypothetical protein
MRKGLSFVLEAAVFISLGLTSLTPGSQTNKPGGVSCPGSPRLGTTWRWRPWKCRADTKASPKHAPADYYYRIPVRPIYKQYPVYAT